MQSFSSENEDWVEVGRKNESAVLFEVKSLVNS